MRALCCCSKFTRTFPNLPKFYLRRPASVVDDVEPVELLTASISLSSSGSKVGSSMVTRVPLSLPLPLLELPLLSLLLELLSSSSSKSASKLSRAALAALPCMAVRSTVGPSVRSSFEMMRFACSSICYNNHTVEQFRAEFGCVGVVDCRVGFRLIVVVQVQVHWV